MKDTKLPEGYMPIGPLGIIMVFVAPILVAVMVVMITYGVTHPRERLSESTYIYLKIGDKVLLDNGTTGVISGIRGSAVISTNMTVLR